MVRQLTVTIGLQIDVRVMKGPTSLHCQTWTWLRMSVGVTEHYSADRHLGGLNVHSARVACESRAPRHEMPLPLSLALQVRRDPVICNDCDLGGELHHEKTNPCQRNSVSISCPSVGEEEGIEYLYCWGHRPLTGGWHHNDFVHF